MDVKAILLDEVVLQVSIGGGEFEDICAFFFFKIVLFPTRCPTNNNVIQINFDFYLQMIVCLLLIR